MCGQHVLLDPPPDDIKIPFKFIIINATRVGDHDLLDFGAGRIGLLADDRCINGNLPPAVDIIPEGENLAFNNRAAGFLRFEVGFRQKHHANGQLAVNRLMPRAHDMFLEEIMRNLDMDAAAVARFAVRIDGAAVPDRLQGINARFDHGARGSAVNRRHQANATIVPFLRRVIHAVFGQKSGIIRPGFDECFALRETRRQILDVFRHIVTTFYQDASARFSLAALFSRY